MQMGRYALTMVHIWSRTSPFHNIAMESVSAKSGARSELAWYFSTYDTGRYSPLGIGHPVGAYPYRMLTRTVAVRGTR